MISAVYTDNRNHFGVRKRLSENSSESSKFSSCDYDFILSLPLVTRLLRGTHRGRVDVSTVLYMCTCSEIDVCVPAIDEELSGNCLLFDSNDPDDERAIG